MRKITFTLLVALQCLTANAFEGKVEINGIYYYIITKGAIAEVVWGPSPYKGDIVIPSSVEYEGTTCTVTSIGNSAFDMSYVTSVTIPNTVTKIGIQAFYWCDRLKSVYIPSSVTSIGENAFYKSENLETIKTDDIESWCKMEIDKNGSPLQYAQHFIVGEEEITDLVIPSTITYVPNRAFLGYKGLKTVTCSEGVAKIGYYAFERCTGLTSVALPNSILTIAPEAFYNCTSLSSITFPEGLQGIGSSCFEGCIGLTSLSLPNSLLLIEAQAFQNCKNIKTIRIGNGLIAMGTWAFRNCLELTDVYCLAETPPQVKGYYSAVSLPFYGSHVEYATLHVPEVSISSYQKGDIWKGFGTIVALTEEETGIETTSISNNDVQSYYSLDGKHLDAPQKGINIVKMANGQTKKVVIK